jgi:hypothetical protein
MKKLKRRVNRMVLIGIAGSTFICSFMRPVHGRGEPAGLSRAYFLKMDTNQDLRVSRSEFVDCGVAVLRQQGKKASVQLLNKKFDRFDRDGDGFITNEDSLHDRASDAGRGGADTGEHSGDIRVSAKIVRSSDKQVEVAHRQVPLGIQDITTTQKIKTQTQTLNISIYNTGPRKGTFRLCWYFLCHPHDDAEEVRVHDHGSVDISLGSRKRTKHFVTAKGISVVDQIVEKDNNETSYDHAPVYSTRGDAVEGYVVLLKSGDTVLDTESHDPEFLSDQWLEVYAALDPAVDGR